MKIKVLNKKRLVIRVVLFFALILLCFALFYAGKEHEIILDNKVAEIEGTIYQPVAFARVTVDGNLRKPIKLNSGERSVVKPVGRNHIIKVEMVDEKTEKVIKSVERKFNFGKISKLMISIPALLEDKPDIYLPLPGNEAEPMSPAPEEKVVDTEADISVEMEAPVLSD
jgi:hypothetical protein